MPTELWLSHRDRWRASASFRVDYARATEQQDLFELFPDMLLDLQSKRVFWLVRCWGKS